MFALPLTELSEHFRDRNVALDLTIDCGYTDDLSDAELCEFFSPSLAAQLLRQRQKQRQRQREQDTNSSR